MPQRRNRRSGLAGIQCQNRVLPGSANRRRLLSLSLLLALGACSQNIRQCLQGPGGPTADGTTVLIPQGCAAKGLGATGQQVIVCRDGREGFIAGPAIGS